jgi:hypothetical protein
MRIRAFLRPASLLLAMASPALLLAQFQQPTSEELKMTADPKAPGAAAVYLNVSEMENDPLAYRSYYARIKVLQEKGKELATVEIPYQHGPVKVEAIQGRTIHSDGTVIPLAVKPEDLLTSKTSTGQVSRMVFTLPSVEVGSILEYYFQLHYDYFALPPMWEIQKPFFVHKAHYSYTPMKQFMDRTNGAPSTSGLVDGRGNIIRSLNWWQNLPAGIEPKVEASYRYTLEMTDVPPIPQEEWMPPIQTTLYQLNFYYLSAYNGADYWISEAKRWSKDVDHFAEPTTALRAAVAGIVAPGDSDLDKAKKLYKAVQALDNTDFSRAKGQSELKQLGLHATKRAEDTWNQKSGSSQDIALLYLALARAAGLAAYDMKVVDRDRGIFALGYLNFDQLDDDIVILGIGGQEIVVDPGEKMCPFQMVHWRHTGAGGVRQSGSGPATGTSPLLPYNVNTLVRIGDVAVNERGGIAGNFRFVMAGQQALQWRQAALRQDVDEVKKRFDEWLGGMVPAGVEAHVDRFVGLDDPSANLIAAVKVQGAPGTATAKRVLLPGFFFETQSHPFVDQAQRLEPVDMHYAEQVTDQVVYHLPASLALESAPQDAKIPWEGHGVLVVKTKTDASQITITRSLAHAFTILKPEEYQDLRGFYQKVAASDQQQLVLTASPAAKGN